MNEDLNKCLGNINTSTLKNLIATLKKVHTKRNVLLLDFQLTSQIDFLTPFSKIREAAGIQKTLLIGDVLNEEMLSDIDGVIILFQESEEVINRIHEITLSLPFQKVFLIGKSISRTLVYKMNEFYGKNLSADRLIEFKADATFRLDAKCTLMNWEAFPLVVDTNVISLEMADKGVFSYFNRPLEQIDALGQAYIDLLTCSSSSSIPLFKLKNIYGKGDHADLLINILQNQRLPEFLALNLSPEEALFYSDVAIGNTDLVVLERNLDYSSVFMSQSTYHGLLDDFFTIELDSLKVGGQKYKLDDNLYDKLKNLNFASIGNKLKLLAQILQEEYMKKDTLQDLSQIRELVKNLGDMSNRRDLVKKHTDLSSHILNRIKFGSNSGEPTDGDNVYDEYEQFLKFQNEIFDIDYKTQVNVLTEFFNQGFSFDIIISVIVLISLINDGIREKDVKIICQNVSNNFGLKKALVMEKMLEFKIIHTCEEADLITEALSFFGQSDKAHASERFKIENKKLGISGGLNSHLDKYKLIDKFWNLHPDYEINLDGSFSESLTDEYADSFFTLPSNTVPLMSRLVESLYFRDFLKYKVINNVSRRPNWDKLELDKMFEGKTTDINLCNMSSSRENKNSATIGMEYVIVIAIGGISRAEISSLRFLEEKFANLGMKKKIIILTPGIITRADFIKSLSLPI